MGALFGWLGVTITNALGMLLGAGWRAFLGTTLIAILMVTLYNQMVDIVQEVLQFAMTQINSAGGSSGPPSTSLQFVGLAGYLAQRLKLVECFAWVINIVLLKWMLVKIPFIKW